MKKEPKAIKIILSFLLCLLLLAVPSGAFAADKTDTDADRKTEELNEYIRSLLLSVHTADAELSELSGMIEQIDAQLEENNELLGQLEEDSAQQEKNMRKRIRFLYESSDRFNLIEALLTADSIGDAINNTSYISRIVDYDRKMLLDYTETIDRIEALQTELKDNRAKLADLQVNYNDKGIELSSLVSDVPEQMAEFGVEEDEIGQVIENYIAENPDVLTEIAEAEAEVKEEHAEPDTAEAQLAQKEPEAVTELQAEEENEPEPETEPAKEPEPEKEPEPATVKETTTEQETTTVQETTTQQETTTVPETTQPETEPETEPETPAGSPNDDPVWNLARITYLENGVMYPESSYQSIYLTACVVINRANAWYNGSIMDSIYAPGAYATAYKYDGWDGGELVINDITWQAVNEALANPDPNPFYQCNGSWLEGNGLKEYYRDPVTDEVFYYLD